MAGLQTIIDRCNKIDINRRKVVGIQYTRNEIPRTSLTPTKNPWKITLTMPNSFRYSEARQVIEELDTLDQYQPQVVTFSDLPQLSWIFAYQGTMSPGQINGITVSSFVGNQLILQGVPPISSNRLLFASNDFIQIKGYPYPFTSTTNVFRGTGSTVTITTNRPNIISNSVTGLGIVVGNNVSFNVFCPNMPTYSLIVGGYQYDNIQGIPINNALIQWSDSFKLYEYCGAA